MRTEISKFRLRDFTCLKCTTKTGVFGNDEPPTHCAVCGEAMPVEPDFDQVVISTKSIQPYEAK